MHTFKSIHTSPQLCSIECKHANIRANVNEEWSLPGTAASAASKEVCWHLLIQGILHLAEFVLLPGPQLWVSQLAGNVVQVQVDKHAEA